MELSDATFHRLRDLAHHACGLSLGDDKAYLVQHRLEPVVRAQGLRSFEDLCDSLTTRRDGYWNNLLIEALTTRETSFFRDGHPFETLRRQVFSNWWSAESLAARRIWSAGTSTGQEAYSLAMLAYDHRQSSRSGRNPDKISILATDICTTALDTARQGVYSSRDAARGLTDAQLHRYFTRMEGSWQIREPVRRLVEFHRVNLVEPLVGLGTFDLILCRNVLIYFDEPTRQRICNAFERLLAGSGWLLLGAAESLYGVATKLQSVRLGDTLLYRT